MTKSLTEQWKDGKLQFGKTYWCSDDEGNVAKLVLVNNDRFYEWTLGTEVTKDVKEVIAPVPNYDGYIELVSKIEQLEKNLEVSEKAHYKTLEQLRIATNALKEIPDLAGNNENGINDYGIVCCAQDALEEMEGVK